MTRALLKALVVCLTAPLLGLAACGMQPKSVPCSNAGDCAAAGDQYHFCAQSRCVECLDDASCGSGSRCSAGLCERSCRDGRDCPSGAACKDGSCAR